MDQLPLKPTESTGSIVQIALLFEVGVAALAVLIGWFLHTQPMHQILWRIEDAGLGALATLPMIVVLIVMRRIRNGPLGRLNGVVDRLLVPLFAGCSVIELLLVALTAGLGEEMLFRGVVQPVAVHWFGAICGIALASVVFGLLHAISVAYFLLATAVGAYYGWLTIATGNLLPAIVSHALYDWFALVYMIHQVQISGSTSSDTPPG